MHSSENVDVVNTFYDVLESEFASEATSEVAPLLHVDGSPLLRAGTPENKELKEHPRSFIRTLRITFRYSMLIYFSIVNLVTYLDRGILAGSLPAIRQDFDVSHTAAGALSSSFMVGFIITSPIFAHLVNYFPAFKLISVGLVTWTIATGLCGLFNSYWAILICRCFVGVGEASFVGIAPVFIDEYATRLKAVWLSFFYAMLPVGGALGFSVGGFVNDVLSWKWSFLIESFLMTPCAIISLVVTIPLRNPDRKRDVDDDELEMTTKMSMIQEVRELLKNPTYMLAIAGYSSYIFVFGGFAVMASDYIVSRFEWELTSADYSFGAINVVCGIVGSIVGGMILDFMGKTVNNALRLCLLFVAISFPLCLVAFLVKASWLFFLFLFLGEFFLMLITTPIAGAILWSVDLPLRSFAMAVSVFAIHLFGDAVSPLFIGYLWDKTQEPNATMIFLVECLLFSVVFWFFALIFCDNKKMRCKD